MKKLPLFIASLALSLGVTAGAFIAKNNVQRASAAEETYTHAFIVKPSSGTNNLSGINWTLGENTKLNNYNSANYAGVQIGSSGNNGSLTMSTNVAWGTQEGSQFETLTKISKVYLWLNHGGGTITPTVSIGGVAANSDNTPVVKNSSAGSDWTKTTKVTFTPASTQGSSGIVSFTINTSSKAGYICAIQIVCENPASDPATYTGVSVEPNGTWAGDLVKGGRFINMKATVSGTNNPKQTVFWKLTNTNNYSDTSSVTVASIDAAGKVTFLDNGYCFVWATSTEAEVHNTTGYCLEQTELVADPVYTKVTSPEGLFIGQRIIIGGTHIDDKNSINASAVMSYQGDNNVRGLFVDNSNVTSTTIKPDYANSLILTIGMEEMENGTAVYTFMYNGLYLNAVSSSSNYLRSTNTVTTNAKFKISFTNNKFVVDAQGNYSRNRLRFNYNNGTPLFSLYDGDGAGTDAPDFYTLETPTAAQAAEAFVIRYMKMVSVPTTENGTGKCISENWYRDAKEGFQRLSNEARLYFVSNYAAAYQRLATWSFNNGDSMNITSSGEVTFSSAQNNSLLAQKSCNLLVICIVSISLVSLAGTLIILKRKKAK